MSPSGLHGANAQKRVYRIIKTIVNFSPKNHQKKIKNKNRKIQLANAQNSNDEIINTENSKNRDRIIELAYDIMIIIYRFRGGDDAVAAAQ